MSLSVNSSRLAAELEKLATYSDMPSPAVTRVLFTKTDLAARDYLKSLFRDAGLKVREDAIGNLFARWTGQDDSAAIGTGSHADAIPNAGRFDGTVGVLGGLEAIRALQSAGFKPKKSIELLMFTSEEPTRFGLGCLGSRVLANAIDLEKVRALVDKDGLSVDAARAAAGMTGTLESVALPKGYYSAFVELHIEQGPDLHRDGVPIGAVTAIAAPAALRVILTGEGGHAGVVLMPNRRDALAAAAEIVLAVEAAARGSGSPDAVATTGVCRVFPGAVNSVPSRVELEIDIRDAGLESRDWMVAVVRGHIGVICQRRRVDHTLETLNADPPAQCDESIVTAIEASAKEANLDCRRMVSRAYHDSLFMARIAPAAMIFIPCKDGISHRPDEFSSPQEIARGAEVLARTLAKLAS